MAMGATPLLPLPVRCTPVAPSAGAVTRPRASSVSDSAMAQGELARSLRRAGKATVGERSLPAVSDSGSRAPADGTRRMACFKFRSNAKSQRL
jgi:hypothetical protein